MRVLRRLQVSLPGLTTRPLPPEAPRPGVHGRKRVRLSEHAARLREKQKLRFHYGVSERQLRRYYRQAAASGGVTGEVLLALLERRLDNVVFRLGFAPTIPAARQLVSHGHILVNGRRVDIASYATRAGDVVSVRPESRSIPLVADEVQRGRYALPSFLAKDTDDPFTGRVVGTPVREDVPLEVDERLVIEYYGGR